MSITPNNISWNKKSWELDASADGGQRALTRTENISKEEFITSKEELLTKCKQLTDDIESLYTKAQNKDLYDALVTLHSVERSINRIYIKEEEKEDDKRKSCTVSESES